jgi:hypothetical protein
VDYIREETVYYVFPSCISIMYLFPSYVILIIITNSISEHYPRYLKARIIFAYKSCTLLNLSHIPESTRSYSCYDRTNLASSDRLDRPPGLDFLVLSLALTTPLIGILVGFRDLRFIVLVQSFV